MNTVIISIAPNYTFFGGEGEAVTLMEPLLVSPSLNMVEGTAIPCTLGTRKWMKVKNR